MKSKKKKKKLKKMIFTKKMKKKYFQNLKISEFNQCQCQKLSLSEMVRIKLMPVSNNIRI